MVDIALIDLLTSVKACSIAKRVFGSNFINMRNFYCHFEYVT